MTQDAYRNPTPTPPATDIGVAPTPADELQFDRAESAAPTSPAALAGFQPAPPGAATTCAVCSRPITDYYFESGGKLLCPQCQQMVAATLSSGSGFVRFLKATIFGLAAGVVGGTVWWAVAYFFHGTVHGLIAILLGILVGGAVRAGAQRRGGIGYQFLALLITYLAVGAGLIAAELTSPDRNTGDASFTGVALVIISIIGVLVGPVLAAVSSPIVGFIIAFALWEAWKINKHRPVVINGPYRVAPSGPPMESGAPMYAAVPGYSPPMYGAPAPPPAQAAPGAWPPAPPTGGGA